MACGDEETLPKAVLAYSHSWLPAQVDGVAVRMMAHVKAMVARGVKVTVVTPDFVLPADAAAGSKQAPQLDAIEGVEHLTVRSQLTPIYRKNMCSEFSIKNLRTFVQIIRRTKPDLVHGTTEAAMQVLATACMICGVPLVISMHTDVAAIAASDKHFSNLGSGCIGRLHAKAGVFFTYWGYRNWAIAGATYFCVSRQARAIMDTAGVRSTRVADGLWGPMVDREIFRIDIPADKVEEERQRLSFGIEDAFLMVYVGRVTAEKDVGFLVKALQRAPRRCILALVGPGSLVQELAQMHGPQHRLHCEGTFVGREQVALALRAADCCVSASTMETIGFLAMEAISCGTPMLAANAQGFAEHLSHGVNSRLFTPKDEESFDRELETLMTTSRTGCWTREHLRESMATASLEACTVRVTRAYKSAWLGQYLPLRYFLTTFLFALQWFFSCFIS